MLHANNMNECHPPLRMLLFGKITLCTVVRSFNNTLVVVMKEHFQCHLNLK